LECHVLDVRENVVVAVCLVARRDHDLLALSDRPGRLEESDRPHHVRVVRAHGITCADPHNGVRGEVEDILDLVGREDLSHEVEVGDVSLVDDGVREVDLVPPTGVPCETHDVRPLGEETMDDGHADEPGGARDEHILSLPRTRH
jgi:hypothetical protein